MFFEGSEKKIEVVTSGVDLRSLGRAFWADVVAASKACILSELSTDKCDSYLLSESSLFVWKDRFTMITCGQTTLAVAASFAIQKLGKNRVEFLTFERKNEYLPEQQKTNFFQDVEILSKVVDGKLFRFGDESRHHLYLFHSTKPYTPPAQDVTLEVLMYGIQGKSREIFNQPGQSIHTLHQATGVDKILPDFKVDGFAFDPFGYSLNALKGSDYFTVHVTPQDCSSYVSFETNYKIDQNHLLVLQKVIGVFEPKAFDLVVFRTGAQEFIDVPGFAIQSATKQELSVGYTVNHCHFEQISKHKLTHAIIKQSSSAVELGAIHGKQ